ncbi:MAG: Rrf2 family transcriptional regulator [Candidatus Omnitrophica bacterium]|nr:Rrf2 family transcriptional regulator [Candidatus Omnitrophota bacterium]
MLDNLALHYGHLVTISDLASRAEIPVKFLEQVLLELKRGGFVESRRGKIGGYLLARAPSLITVGDVIRFIEGPIEPIACVDKNYKGCTDVYKCVFKPLWADIAKSTSLIIDTVTFEDLVNRTKKQKQGLVYSI